MVYVRYQALRLVKCNVQSVSRQGFAVYVRDQKVHLDTYHASIVNSFNSDHREHAYSFLRSGAGLLSFSRVQGMDQAWRGLPISPLLGRLSLPAAKDNGEASGKLDPRLPDS